MVLSRYNGVRGFDWIAIPLVPYLYAVERQEDVPLYADTKTLAFLRDRYRRKHLKGVAPDLPNGETPGGNWYELSGHPMTGQLMVSRLRPAVNKMRL